MGTETVRKIDIDQEMRNAYLDYAMSVIVARALPDVRDGLKPVHRRILYAMHDMGLRPDRPYKKSARIVGEVLGKYHPHGDAAVYEAMARMAQDFSLRYMLVDGQGNFGSIDGDSPAAMRYCVTGDTLVRTEEGLTPIADLVPDTPENSEHPLDLGVLSFQGKEHRADRLFNSGRHPVKEVVTDIGLRVTGTDNHPLLTWEPDATGRPRFLWKPLSQIQVGDYLVVDRTPGFAANGHKGLDDPDLALLLGALVAEGYSGPARVGINNTDRAFIDTVESILRAKITDRVCRYEREIKSGKTLYELQIHEQAALQKLADLGLGHHLSGEKRIMPAVLQAGQEVQAAFLRALFEGDGSVFGGRYRQGKSSTMMVVYTSKSRRLLEEIQILLLNFGIVSRIRRDRNNHRLLIVGYENLRRFGEQIGFWLGKRARFEQIFAQVFRRPSLSHTDYIPFLSKYIRTRYSAYGLHHYNIDRYDRIGARQDEILAALDDRDADLYRTLLTHRYYFTPVVAVQPAGEQVVYSIRVRSRCHSFVANGLIHHNTEARLAPIAEEMLADIDKDTVDFVPNFDDTLTEPAVLPAVLPNLLLNGASGIAVGMATNIPPHNLNEVCDALIYLIDHYQKVDDVTVEDLTRFIRGPDFPTGGIVYRFAQEGDGDRVDLIRNAYALGRGRLTVQARVHIEQMSRNRSRIVVTELPYQVNKTRLIERIAELVRDNRLEGIADLRDESDRQGMRICIELTRTVEPRQVLSQLFKLTPMQSTFSLRMLALVEGEPRLLPLKQALLHYLEHRQEVITRRSRYLLEKAKRRAHILEGLLKALDHIDEVIDTIRRSRTADTARKNLMKRFKFTEVQAQAILDMPLRRLAGLERRKIAEEYKEKQREIKYLQGLLRSPAKIRGVIRQDLLALKQRYGDERRTHIAAQEKGHHTARDLVEDQEVLVTLWADGQVVRTTRPPRVSSKAVPVAQVRGNTRDDLALLTADGRAALVPLHQLSADQNTPIGHLTDLEGADLVAALILPHAQPGEELPATYLTLVTEGGRIKRIALADFVAATSRGAVSVIKIEAGDRLLWAAQTGGQDQVLLVTRKGKAIRFAEGEVRAMGLTAAGVWAVKLAPRDAVVGGGPVREGDFVITFSEKGYAKRTAVSAFSTQKRYGSGVQAARLTAQSGPLAVAALAGEDRAVVLVTAKKRVVKLPVRAIRSMGRATGGQRTRQDNKEPFLDAGKHGPPVRLVVLAGSKKATGGKRSRSKSTAARKASGGAKAASKRSPRKRSPRKKAGQAGGEAQMSLPMQSAPAKKTKRSPRKRKTVRSVPQ